MGTPETIMIDDEKYVKESISQPAKTMKGLKYVICRTYSAGVFAGYLESLEGKNAVVLKGRRLWKWSGAASLSQLAMEGTSAPNDCKFPIEVDRVELTEAIELLDVTEKARKSIASVKIWSA